ncbi:hypothetical protein HDK77DRAFT_268828 [Phyllosticta capitalensis]
MSIPIPSSPSLSQSVRRRSHSRSHHRAHRPPSLSPQQSPPATQPARPSSFASPSSRLCARRRRTLLLRSRLFTSVVRAATAVGPAAWVCAAAWVLYLGCAGTYMYVRDRDTECSATRRAGRGWTVHAMAVDTMNGRRRRRQRRASGQAERARVGGADCSLVFPSVELYLSLLSITDERISARKGQWNDDEYIVR